MIIQKSKDKPLQVDANLEKITDGIVDVHLYPIKSKILKFATLFHALIF
jgi:hypothetical protein